MPPTEPRSDQELIAALNAGDASAFDALYHRYRDRILRLAFRFTANHADAQDVLQETFTYFYRKFPGFVLTAQMTTFLFPVVRNLSLAARRKRRPGESGGLGGAAEMLEDLSREDWVDPRDVEALRVEVRERVRATEQHSGSFEGRRRLRLAMIDAERRMLIRLRNEDAISDEVLRELEQELDLEAVRAGAGEAS